MNELLNARIKQQMLSDLIELEDLVNDYNETRYIVSVPLQEQPATNEEAA